MADTEERAEVGQDTEDEDLTRVLIPSTIGMLGITLAGEILTGVSIVPKGRERKRYTEFSQIDGSDFLDEVLGRFSEYFAGARRDLGLEYDLEASGLDRFARRVLRQTAKVRYGDRKTYQQIATAAGRPDAYRNVLAVLLANPLPIVVPCHRITTAKSGVGSYIGGVRKKEWLLKMERRTLAARRSGG
jgi:O-6-methylguanine DNA methyltransferase